MNRSTEEEKMTKNPFFKLTVIILFLIVTSPFFTAAATEEDWRPLTEKEQGRLLERLVTFQKSIKTFQSNFMEIRSTKVLSSPLSFEGKIYYDATGLFFMHYLEPVRYVLRVKEGEALFFVEGSKTADVVDISNMEGMARHSNLFAWKPDAFTGSIWVSKSAYRLEDSSGKTQGKGKGRKILIFLDRRTLHMERLRIEDEFGDLTEIALSNQSVNEELPIFVTDFSLPEGIKINRMDNLK